MHDPNGRRITAALARGGFGNYEGALYMRRSNVELYLKENGLDLIWIIDGERQKLESSGMNAGYKQYQFVYKWRNGKLKRL
jgi:hypothetical protein